MKKQKKDWECWADPTTRMGGVRRLVRTDQVRKQHPPRQTRLIPILKNKTKTHTISPGPSAYSSNPKKLNLGHVLHKALA
jgi:hypothetical protein